MAKVLLFDIETIPLLSYTWGTFQQNISLNQIHKDWSVLSWAAKWRGKGEPIMYLDQRGKRDIRNDKRLLLKIRNLLDKADIVITQNGVRFDAKKLNARFAIHKIKPPSPFKHIDTYQLARRYFAFTSNKLEYMASVLCPDQKKSQHKKFPGFEMWDECMKGNLEAFIEMEKYNKQDVLTLEAVWEALQPYVKSINFNIFHNGDHNICACGGSKFNKNGYALTETGKYQRYRCVKCHARYRDNVNLLSKSKKRLMRKAV